MNQIALVKQEIINQLSLIPDERLSEIHYYLQFLIHQSKSSQKSPAKNSLNGIWNGLGFEKLIELDTEINQLRKVSR